VVVASRDGDDVGNSEEEDEEEGGREESDEEVESDEEEYEDEGNEDLDDEDLEYEDSEYEGTRQYKLRRACSYRSSYQPPVYHIPYAHPLLYHHANGDGETQHFECLSS
jgi:hypothetical protein